VASAPERPALSGPEITAEGRLAGRVFAVLLVATGVGVLAAGWDDLWRRCGQISGPCVSRAAGAVLLSVAAVVAIGVGLFTWRRVARRPVDPEGSSRFVWWFGLLFLLGGVFAASRIPAFTCSRGRFDELLELCMHPPSTSEPSRWSWAKDAVVAGGVVGALAIVARPRLARVGIPAAALVFVGGTGWLVLDTLVRRP
jgi:hypothetical protein